MGLRCLDSARVPILSLPVNLRARPWFQGSQWRGLAIMAICLAVSAGACFSARARPVVVAAYNVENYLPMVREGNAAEETTLPKPEEEIRGVVAVILGVRPDILLVVEIGKEDMLDDLQSRLKKSGWDLPHREWVRGADPDRHLALLSRFPIVSRQSADNVPFELGGTPHFVGRGFLDVTVDAGPLGPLRLMGAHLKSRRPVPGFDEAQLRAREADLLRQRIKDALEADPSLQLIALGDFNDVKNSAPIRQLIGQRGAPDYMADVWLRDSRGEAWTHYWKAADTYSRIDYLLISPALVPRLDMQHSGIADPPAWDAGSDHRLIYAAFQTPEVIP
ncbi:MAG: hypothetical protein Fur0032_22080 [Terrimicrobiaceae bacterium]